MNHKWTVEDLQKAEWFAPLLELVQAEFDRLTASGPDLRESVVGELAAIENQIGGWTLSLGNAGLGAAARRTIEQSLEEAIARKEAMEFQLKELEAKSESARLAADPEAVVERLNRLADVLAGSNPARINVELAQHVDSIRCFADGRVVVRVCKLGALGGSLDLEGLREESASHGDSSGKRGRGRVRKLALRSFGGAGPEDRDLAEFATDTGRFNGLDASWFWEEIFDIPRPPCWARDYAEQVAAKQSEMSWSVKELAEFFGKTTPTIRDALKRAKLAGAGPQGDSPGSGPLVQDKG